MDPYRLNDYPARDSIQHISMLETAILIGTGVWIVWKGFGWLLDKARLGAGASRDNPAGNGGRS